MKLQVFKNSRIFFHYQYLCDYNNKLRAAINITVNFAGNKGKDYGRRKETKTSSIAAAGRLE